MQTDFPPVTPPSLPTNASRNNTLAIVSLGLSIAALPFLCLSFVFAFVGCLSGLLAIGGLVTGLIATQQIKSTGQPGETLALIGMILGGVQVALVTCGLIFFALLYSTALAGLLGTSIFGH